QGGLTRPVWTNKAHPVAAEDPDREIFHHREVAEAFCKVFRLDHELPGQCGVARTHRSDALGATIIAMASPQFMKLGKPAHIAFAPRGHAIAQPMLLARNLASELLLLPLLLFEELVPPILEIGEALFEAPRHPAIE